MEIVTDSTEMLQAQAMTMMKDKTLTALLDKPFSDSLENELKHTLGVGISQLDQLKPMTVTLTLSMVYLMKHNDVKLKQYAGLPLDAWLVKEGKQQGKNVTALETMKEQMDLLFNRTSDEEQVAQLQTFLRNKDMMVVLGDELMQSWFDHDLNNLYCIYAKTLQLSGEEDFLVKSRNARWMEILPGKLQSGPHFIGVGALHLAGPDGLVKQLERKGYTLTPIK